MSVESTERVKIVKHGQLRFLPAGCRSTNSRAIRFGDTNERRNAKEDITTARRRFTRDEYRC
jgi:hypothetical protein